jgi:hypothetical protein
MTGLQRTIEKARQTIDFCEKLKPLEAAIDFVDVHNVFLIQV